MNASINKLNLFENIPNDLSREYFETLLANPCLKIERIVSRGHASPPDFWYDQNWDEWVVLLKGSAGVCFELDPQTTTLGPGDALLIPAHAKHRVQWTDAENETVWLAIHIGRQDG